MRTSFHRFAFVFGLLFGCAGLLGFLILLTEGVGTALPALVIFAFGLAIANHFQTVRIDENGIISWRLLKGRTRVRWEDVREIGIGNTRPARIIWASRRDLAYVYVSGRPLADEERCALNPMKKDMVVFRYLEMLAPQRGRPARCREALQRYYPGKLPPDIAVLIPEDRFKPVYVTRNENADGSISETIGAVIE